MAVSTITSIKKAIGYKVSAKKDSETKMPKDSSLALVPTVGFRVGYKMGTSVLQVCVLGARHLPARVGVTPVSGYTIKVCTSAISYLVKRLSRFTSEEEPPPFLPGTCFIESFVGSRVDLDWHRR
jgi:hypothetical protein